MSDSEIRYLGDVQRLQLQEGDTVVLSVDHHLSHAQAIRHTAWLKSEVAGS